MFLKETSAETYFVKKSNEKKTKINMTLRVETKKFTVYKIMDIYGLKKKSSLTTCAL